MIRKLALAMFRDLGFSKKSAEMRVNLLEKMAECDRRGIDIFAEIRKSLDAANIVAVIPSLPTFSFSISLPTIRCPLS